MNTRYINTVIIIIIIINIIIIIITIFVCTQVLGQVLKRLGWEFVVVVYENNAYGREAYSNIRPVLADQDICLTAAFMADGGQVMPAAMQNILKQVNFQKKKSSVYVWFLIWRSWKCVRLKI